MSKKLNESRRPEASVLKEFSRLSSADVCLATEGNGAMTSLIRPIYHGARICGSAITVRTAPGDNLYCHKAIEYVQKLDVIVVNAHSTTSAACWGEFTSLSAKRQGAVGAVVDGAVTDVGEIERMRFPTFAKAVTPRTTHREGYGDVNIAISCGGVSVDPGDIVVGDGNGVVVVPISDASEVLKKAQRMARLEDEARREIMRGKLLPQLSKVDEILRRKSASEQ